MQDAVALDESGPSRDQPGVRLGPEFVVGTDA
jgi:hypothetical protein